MEIASALAGTQPAATTRKAATTISSDFDTFLKMLTAQIQNQDPLNPIDSADYAVQLATFSSVEQQTKTNQLLENLSGQFDMMGMAQLAGWVGNEARFAGSASFDGAPITLSPDPPAVADRAVLVVSDPRGTVVGREDIPVSSAPYDWLGAGITGSVLPSGHYSFSLESYSGDQLISIAPVESYARITEVQGGTGGNRLILAGGITVSADQITALRSGS